MCQRGIMCQLDLHAVLIELCATNATKQQGPSNSATQHYLLPRRLASQHWQGGSRSTAVCLLPLIV
jgi:hypothetical protein